MNISEYLQATAFAVLGLQGTQPPVEEEKMAFVNDFEDVVRQKVVEAKTWYDGDSDNLLNLYNYDERIEFRTERWYWKNKRSYFWARSSSENDVKRTHSGFARAMVDTLVNIVGTPLVTVADEGAQKRLDDILKENSFWENYSRRQMPMTLVEGWGGWKITWDEKVYGQVPVVDWCGALECRCYRKGNRVVGMTFMNWYEGADGKRYMVAETRVRPPVLGAGGKSVVHVFQCAGDELTLVSNPEEIGLKVDKAAWEGLPCLFAVPCSFFADNLHGYDGKGVLDGKIDILDDLDQALSQCANTVRRSTPVEVYNLDYAERDKGGRPKLPSLFERRYVGVQGKRNAMGETDGLPPVTVTQPSLNVDLYASHIEQLERAIINGVLSPAVLGLDISKRDGADSIREKDKTTVFVRNSIAKREKEILESLFNQLLVADEWLRTKQITVLDYGVNVEFDEFSDVSFENKISSLAAVLANDAMSPEEFVSKAYGKSISPEDAQREIDWIKSMRQQQQQDGGEGDDEAGMFHLDEPDLPEEELPKKSLSDV